MSAVDHPRHYNSHPSGVECVEIAEWIGFNLGNALKYVWRAGLKSDDPEQDYAKSAWYIRRHLEIDGHEPLSPMFVVTKMEKVLTFEQNSARRILIRSIVLGKSLVSAARIAEEMASGLVSA